MKIFNFFSPLTIIILLLLVVFIVVSVNRVLAKPATKIDEVIIGNFQRVGTFYPSGSPISGGNAAVTQTPYNPGFSHANLNAVDIGSGGLPRRVVATHDGILKEGNMSNCTNNTYYNPSGGGNGYGCHYFIYPEEGAPWATQYAHCAQPNSALKTGDPISAGDFICDMGNSGYSTGMHLHYEFKCISGALYCAINVNNTTYELRIKQFFDEAFFPVNGEQWGVIVPSRN